MKKCILVFTVFIGFSLCLNAQREASNWFFGDGAGIRFEANGDITPTTGSLNTDEGCASISDSNGELLFYTDGIFVYDTNGNLMQNGFGLHGSPSSTQSAIIVPKPQDPDVYYIFTVGTQFGNNPDLGFKYSEVNMTLNGGLGAVVNKNVLLLNDSSEKISAVLKDCQTQAIWVITFSTQNGFPGAPSIFNTFYAYEVTVTGVSTTPVRSTISTLNITGQRGYLKLSPDGTKLACANVQGGLFLFDFDVITGQVSIPANQPGPLQINASNGGSLPYGIEFSPSGQYLYVSSYNDFFIQGNNAANNNPNNHFSSLVQFDVTVPNIQASRVSLHQDNGYRSALQLGPDGKIYRTASESYNGGLPYLTYINNPNEQGQTSDYDHQNNRINLNNNSRQGLPPFITSFFEETIDIINDPEITTTLLPLCEGDSFTLTADDIPGATYTWSLDGVVQPLPPVPYEYEVTGNGLYEVLIELNTGDCETFRGEALVEYSAFPEAFMPPNSIQVCDDDGNNDGIYRFNDFNEQRDAILGASQSPLDYTVRYFKTPNDANTGQNEITFPFTNDINNQEIFVRVENRNNSNCFLTNDSNTGMEISFFLEVFNTPEIVLFEDQELCDTEGDTTDGIITLTLTDFNQDILGATQDANSYTISYHATQDDANNDDNPLPADYITDPFDDDIFVRIENDLNEDCYTTDRIEIEINLTPIANDASIFQCDEDGTPDGLTLFNITEIDDFVTNGDPDSNVIYYLNMTDANADANPVDADNFNNTSNPQILIAKVTNAVTECYSISEVILEASATSANDAYLGVCDADGTEDGFAMFSLSEANDQVLNGLPDGLDLAYYKTYEDALLEQNPLPNNYRNEDVGEQIIYVRAENDNNCYGINEVTLEVIGLPNVETFFETLYCLNTFPEPIILNGGVIDDIPNNYYYNWEPTDETTIEIEVNQPGTYTVTVRNVLGCSKERTIVVNASNTATVEDVQVSDGIENNTVTILVEENEDDYEYSLNSPLGPYQASNTFQNVRPGFYTAYIRDLDGCGITEEQISVIGFPKFFTPNGDNQNDFWSVKGVSSQFQSGTKVLIFDKYGKLMAELDPTGSGWDGTYNGNPMPNSDYWFSVTLEDGRQFSSHFSLKR